ncbi:MAG: thioredoxin family protein [Armatimonadetes bacterium]|nr:thioredoxin family protein [Armatimonadota bacterium]
MKSWLPALLLSVALAGCNGPTDQPTVKVDGSGSGKQASQGPVGDGSDQTPAPDGSTDRKATGDGKTPSTSSNPPQDKEPTTPAPSQGQGPTPAQLEKSSLVSWSKTVAEATAEARKDGGYVLLVFEAPWHTGSKIMKKEVFSDAETAKLLQGAHPVSLDVDDPATKELQKEHLVTAIPVMFFVKPGQKPFGMIDGYYDLTLFKKQLRKVLKDK